MYQPKCGQLVRSLTYIYWHASFTSIVYLEAMTGFSKLQYEVTESWDS